MAISQTVITNRLDKKINYGKARTAFHAHKGPLNESIVSPMPQGTDKFWVESHSIPTVSPSANTAIVDAWQFGGLGVSTKGIIEMTLDSTVSSGRTFLACWTYGDKSTRLDAWIPTTYGATYDVKFYIGPKTYHGNYDISTISGFNQIFPSATGTEFYFDTSSGVLSFAGDSIPSGLTSTTSLYLTRGWRYVGNIGLTSYIPTIGSSLVIKEINDPVSNFSQTAVEELHFDVDSGFALTDVSTGGKVITKIAMESTFKTWNVLGQDQLTASGVDEITVAAGDGITLTTTAPPSTIQTYYVKYDSGLHYIIEDAATGGNQVTSFNFISGGTYKFDTSNAALVNSQFEFSITQDGSHNATPGTFYSNGVTYGDSGGSRIADGTAGAYLQIKGKKDTATTLYDYNHDAGGTGDGSGATISAQQKTLTIKNSIIDSSGNAIITGNLTVHGTTTTVNSTVTTLNDPIITLGTGLTTYTLLDDDKDRGIEFKWHDGTTDVSATAIVHGTEYIIKTPGNTVFTLIGASDSLEGTKFTADTTVNTPTGSGEVILATASNVGFFGLDDTSGKFTYIPDGTNASEVYSGDVGIFDLSGTLINEIKDVNVGIPTGTEDGKVLTWDDNTSKFILATPGQSGLTLGAPTDTTYNDGAYYQKNTVVSGGTFLTGVDTAGTVSDALDAVNETIKNIKINKYVQGAVFTVTNPAGAAGSASPANPLAVTFSITDWEDPAQSGYAGEGANGNATFADWEFDNGGTITTVPNHASTLINGLYVHNFIATAGGNIDVTMTLKCESASGTTGLTEGSYMKYKKVAAVELWTPNPEPSFSANVQTVNLDSTLAAERRVEFDASASVYTSWWMMEFGDGTQYPTLADPTETVEATITTGANAWIPWATIKTHIHDYGDSSPTTDKQYSPKIHCRSLTAGGGTGNTQSYERSDYIEGFITPIPSFTTTGYTTGNNDEVGDTNINGDTNSYVGHPVKFTNTTPNLGEWGDTDYTWDWDDGTTTQVLGGSGNPGDKDQIIEHYFELDDPKAEQIFDVTLTAENDRIGIGTNTGVTPITAITTEVDPRADFSGTFTNLSTDADLTSADYHNNALIGYDFVKYNPGVGGGVDSNGASNVFSLTNTSEGTDYLYTDSGLTLNGITYNWTFGDGTADVNSPDATHSYTTSSEIARTVTLITQNDNSYVGGTDDTEVKTNYLTIRPAPPAPDGLTGLTIDIPPGDIVGTDPAIPFNVTNNIRPGSSITPLAAGSAVTRVVTNSLSSGAGTETLSGWANEFPSNGIFTAEVVAHVNDSNTVGGDGMCEFTGDNKVGRYLPSGSVDQNGVLHITTEQDANEISSAIYPDNFYKQFKAKIVPTLLPGYNILQLKHSNPVTESDVTTVIYDPMTNTPTITTFGAIAENAFVYRYMSSVPFYNTGSSLTITGAMVKDLTGETYRLTSEVVRVKNETGTPIIASDTTYTYANIGLNAVPDPNIGVSADHTCSALTLNVDGTGSGDDGVIQMTAHNVNGDATDLVDTTTSIRYWFDQPVLNENSIPMGITYGSQVGSNTVGQRIYYAWPTTGFRDYPSYASDASDNWWTTKTWNSTTQSITNTLEAACYLDKIQHSIVNFSTGYLPAGPNLSTGTYRTTNDTQYFTFAFQRSGLSKLAIKISGEVTSLHIAIPGYNTDLTSSLNGWLDCNQNYYGSGFPGANTNAGTPIGNGSDGVRRTGSNADKGTFDVNIPLTDSFCNLDLGEASTGSAPFPTVLVRFGVANTKSVTAISIENWNPEVGS